MEETTMDQKATEFESLLNQLQREVEESSELAYNLEKKAQALKPFNEGQEKDDSKQTEPQGYLMRLGNLIGRLTDINQQNNRSLSHLSQML